MGEPQLENQTLSIERTKEMLVRESPATAETDADMMQGNLDTRRYAQIANRGPVMLRSYCLRCRSEQTCLV
jgi:hypothetical protein